MGNCVSPPAPPSIPPDHPFLELPAWLLMLKRSPGGILTPPKAKIARLGNSLFCSFLTAATRYPLFGNRWANEARLAKSFVSGGRASRNYQRLQNCAHKWASEHEALDLLGLRRTLNLGT